MLLHTSRGLVAQPLYPKVSGYPFTPAHLYVMIDAINGLKDLSGRLSGAAADVANLVAAGTNVGSTGLKYSVTNTPWGRAFKFNGTDSYANANMASLGVFPLDMGCVVVPTSVAATQAIISMSDVTTLTANNPGIARLQISSAGPTFDYVAHWDSVGNTSTLSSQTVPEVGKQYAIACRSNFSTGHRISVNGLITAGATQINGVSAGRNLTKMNVGASVEGSLATVVSPSSVQVLMAWFGVAKPVRAGSSGFDFMFDEWTKEPWKMFQSFEEGYAR